MISDDCPNNLSSILYPLTLSLLKEIASVTNKILKLMALFYAIKNCHCSHKDFAAFIFYPSFQRLEM